MKKGFTIIELLLAVTLLAILLVVSGAVFRMAAKAYRTAAATGEIARKLRAITDQLDADFRGLRKDAVAFFVWVPTPVDKDGNILFPNAPGFNAANVAGYKRFDRAFFFADGDFQSYGEWPYISSSLSATISKVVHGNVARIGYMIAQDATGLSPQNQPAEERVLARSQHILTKDLALARDLDTKGALMPVPDFPAFGAMPIPLAGNDNVNYHVMNNTREYDWATLTEWNNATIDEHAEMLTLATDIRIARTWDGEATDPTTGGLQVDTDAPPPANVVNPHQVLCEGLAEFSVQGWLEDPLDPLGPRWFPQLDKDGDGREGEDALDTDFGWDLALNIIDSTNVIGIYYHPSMGDIRTMPGIGRALKFTFTLYDSRGIFKKGKTFTHIVYLDD